MVHPFIKTNYKQWEIWGSPIFSTTNHDSQPYSARHIPSFGGAWGGSHSPFLYSFSLLSKTATSLLFVVHLTEISPSTSEKHCFLQYSSPANHDSQPYSARHIPSFGGAWEGSLSLFLYSSPLPYKTATSSPFNCSSLRNKPFHTWETTSFAVLLNTKSSFQTLSRQAHPLLRRGLGRLCFSLYFIL